MCSTKSRDFQRGDRIVSGDNQSTVEQRAGQRLQHQVNSSNYWSEGPTRGRLVNSEHFILFSSRSLYPDSVFILIPSRSLYPDSVLRIRILLVNFDTDPEPTFYFDSVPDPDPDPSFQIKAQNLGKVLN